MTISIQHLTSVTMLHCMELQNCAYLIVHDELLKGFALYTVLRAAIIDSFKNWLLLQRWR